MSTKNPRLNVVLEPKLYSGIRKMANQEGISLSLMARDLLKEAVDLREDLYWHKEARKRDKNLSQTKPLSHQQVWKE